MMAHHAKEKVVRPREQNSASVTVGAARPVFQSFVVGGAEQKADVLEAALQRSLDRCRFHLRRTPPLEPETGTARREEKANRAHAGK